MLAHVEKAALAERRPNREGERLWIIVNWNLYVTANEKVLLIYDTLVRVKVHPTVELFDRNKCSPRCLDAEAQRNIGLLDAAGVACPTHDSTRASDA
jgi:hypothetical protein